MPQVWHKLPIGELKIVTIRIIIVPDSVGGYSLFVSFVCLFVCLFVCVSVAHFSQPCFNTETFTVVSYPGMVNDRNLLNLRLIRPC